MSEKKVPNMGTWLDAPDKDWGHFYAWEHLEEDNTLPKLKVNVYPISSKFPITAKYIVQISVSGITPEYEEEILADDKHSALNIAENALNIYIEDRDKK